MRYVAGDQMTDLKRSIKCSNCGNEASIYLNSELEIKELLFAGKCRCGNSMQVSYVILGDSPPSSSSIPKTESETSPLINIDESLFTPEIPSDALKDLMGD
jgi:hypothetical protein